MLLLSVEQGLIVRHNYLNNKDILKEIHKSKNTYCTYLTPTDADYDIILPDVSKINKKNIKEGRQNRAERLAKLAHEAATADGTKRKLDEFEIKLKDVPDTDVVFRIMTWDHIPVDDAKSRKAALKALEEEGISTSEYDDDTEVDISENTKYVKCNFPPFQHYRVDEEGNPVLVGKSHWQGDLEKGKFSRDHGAMTKKLAHMFMKLCERYATRSNWRGYTYNDEMRSQALLQLSQIGLQFDESKSQNPFAYYTAAITNSFTRVLNIEKRNQNLRDDILEMNNLNPSYTRQGMGFGGGHYDSDE
jgi:ribosomal protein S11